MKPMTETLMANELSHVPATLVVPADRGTILRAFGDTLQVKLNSEQTSGTLAVMLDTTLPNSGPPPHVHHNEDELFLIVEGEYRFLANGEWSEVVGAGTVVYAPRGAMHTFKNVGTTAGRMWVIATPGGLETFFARCANVFAQPGTPDMEAILTISAEQGIEYVPPLAAPEPATV